jgi:hypothetical protein
MGQPPLVNDPDRFRVRVKPDGPHLFTVYIHDSSSPGKAGNGEVTPGKAGNGEVTGVR